VGFYSSEVLANKVGFGLLGEMGNTVEVAAGNYAGGAYRLAKTVIKSRDRGSLEFLI
jgi:hypothetical protein